MHLRGLDLSDLTLDLSLVLEYVLATVNQEETFSQKYEANWFSVGKEKIFTRKKSNPTWLNFVNLPVSHIPDSLCKMTEWW